MRRGAWWVGGPAVLAAMLLAPPGTAQPPAVRVDLFSPRGTVKGVRQVTARFSAPMVPLGDPRPAVDPFVIACPERGTSRWVDSRTWSHDFARDLPAGVRCAFRLREGLASLGGAAVEGERSFAFSTGGPAIRSSWPYEGSQWVHEEQAFVLDLDAPADEASVVAHASFRVDGVPERVGARVLTGDARAAILKAFRRRKKKGPVLVLQARRRFPNATKVSLVWGTGIATASGVATEQDQVLEFTTRPAFTADFTCERARRDAGCLPFRPMEVTFSTPVGWETARRAVLVGPSGERRSPEAPKEPAETVEGVSFAPPFPESAGFTVELLPDLRDDDGRPLANAGRFPLSVRTDEFPPLAKFPARFGIVEWKADPTLPVTLRNLEPEVQARMLPLTPPPAGGLKDFLGRITRVPPERAAEMLWWLRAVGDARRDVSLFAGEFEEGKAPRSFMLPKPGGAKAFEVVGIPFDAPGLYVVEIESPRLGAALLDPPRPMYVPAAALVTNLSVHFKWGRESSLVWVTSLDRAQPVPDAEVAVHDCWGKVIWKGETDRQGIARIDEKLPPHDRLPRCERTPRPWNYRYYYFEHEEHEHARALRTLDAGLFVTARTGDDLGFVHSDWTQGIEPWRFRLEWGGGYSETNAAHTVLDRPLFRAGETVHMKHVLRRRTLRGFDEAPDADRPTRVSLRHAGSDEKYELPLAWDAPGVAESTWQIPREAKLGTYLVVLLSPDGKQAVSGSFQVQEFRVPLAKGTVRLPAEPQVAVREVPVDVGVQYLAGGGAESLPVVLRAQIRNGAPPHVEEFADFTFANGAVKEGIARQRGPAEDEEEEAEGEEAEPEKPGVHQRTSLVLDAAGAARTRVTKLPRAATVRELLTELEFRDPNGEAETVAARVPLWPARWLVGIRPEVWAASKESVKARVAVVDVAGKPVAGAPVRVDLFERKVYSHRKRLVGGFYAYDHTWETKRVATLCEARTDARGAFDCEGRTPVDGNLVVQATVTDDAGRTSTAYREVWVAGRRAWWFGVHDSDRIDLLPEKRRYEPGETARFQVRMPFREATALVAVERDGLLETSVVHLSGTEPVVEVRVGEDWAPNVFVSALVVRGRVGDVTPTATLDLGKPAFKLGIAEIRVGWRAHELRVSVAADRPAYQVRETAKVHVTVRTPDGKVPPPGGEVALAAVDEGLLELRPNRSWELLDAMMGRRAYGIVNATAQMQVVGKRHFGQKALPQGGGGGRQSTRELFDTLLLWKGRVPLDGDGTATVEVPLNDSLTAFRIVAVATVGVAQFGTGSTTIRSTRDLMLLSGVAPLVREGDRFRSEFTVRNATERPLAVDVRGRIEGVDAPLAAQPLTLAPGEARIVGWDVTAPVGVDQLAYEVEASTSGGPSDRVRVTQAVRAAVPVRTFQATLLRSEGPIREPVERPADALPGRGGVQVGLAPTLVGTLDGVRAAMGSYPYTCLEQRVSRAVALRDEEMWRSIAASLPSHTDADGLLQYFPTCTQGSDVLTAYVLAITHEAGFAIPDEVRGRMESGLRRFVEGSILRGSALRTADLSIRKLAALEALSRHDKAEPKLLGSVTIEPNLWPTSAVLDWWRILRRVPGIPGREARLAEVEQIVRSRLNLQGTTMGFSTEATDCLWWLMVCPDTNSVRLLLDLADAGAWREDLPRIVRGAVGRQRRGAWDCTTTNAWGTLAVERFAKAFEATPVGGRTIATLAGDRQEAAWAAPPAPMTLGFGWPAGRGELGVDHDGPGNPWVTIQSRAAIPLAEPFSSGYRITKTVTAREPRAPGRLSRGDLVRVRLEVEAESDMTWVVVSDPIPAGASHLGTGLGRDSTIATAGERSAGRAWPVFEERAFEAFRAYYEYVPKGRFTTEYTIRLNQGGRFQLPPTRVEALYSPEMMGELPNAPVEVAP